MSACPQQFADTGADPRALDPNTSYAVAPSPFFASSDGAPPPGSRDVDDAMITLSITADTQVPARRLSLPLWFATEFLKFRDVASLSSDAPRDAVFVHRPRADIEVTQRTIIGPSQHIRDMTVTGGMSPKNAAMSTTSPEENGWGTVDLLGTTEERTAFASTSAALIFKTLTTVPHRVVPSLVVEFVVAPYAAEVHCTMEEGKLGVTEVTQVELTTPSLDLGRLPNLTKLTIDKSFQGTVPPCVTTLVLKSDLFRDLHSAPYLTSLTLTNDPPLGHLKTLVDTPVSTIRRLSLHGLEYPFESDTDARVRLECLGQLFPNVEFLSLSTVFGSLTSPAVSHAFANENWWPALLELDASAPQVATIASARPHGWRRVTMRASERINLWSLQNGPQEVCLPDTLHVSLSSAVLPETRISAPSLQTLYLERKSSSDSNDDRLVLRQLTAPRLEHVLIDVPHSSDGNAQSSREQVAGQTWLDEVAAAAEPSVRYVTCRSGSTWERCSENTWVEGCVVPPHLDPGDVSVPDLLVVSVRDPRSAPPRPREQCQCYLASK